METIFQPISKRRLAELRGYVAWGIMLFRSILFVGAVAGVTWLLRALHDRLIPPSAHRPPFTWDEYKRYRAGMVNFGFLDVPFAELKSAADRKISGP
jgi:hypothetical protein